MKELRAREIVNESIIGEFVKSRRLASAISCLARSGSKVSEHILEIAFTGDVLAKLDHEHLAPTITTIAKNKVFTCLGYAFQCGVVSRLTEDDLLTSIVKALASNKTNPARRALVDAFESGILNRTDSLAVARAVESLVDDDSPSSLLALTVLFSNGGVPNLKESGRLMSTIEYLASLDVASAKEGLKSAFNNGAGAIVDCDIGGINAKGYFLLPEDTGKGSGCIVAIEVDGQIFSGANPLTSAEQHFNRQAAISNLVDGACVGGAGRSDAPFSR